MMLGQWFQACRALVDRSGGFINKYLGDGFLAFWRESNVVTGSVVQAIQDLRKLQRQHAPDFRLVVHHGEVVFNSVITSAEENLSGPSLSFVFRMEKLAGSLGQHVLLSQSVAGALKGLVDSIPAGEHSLAGFAGRHRFFTLAANDP